MIPLVNITVYDQNLNLIKDLDGLCYKYKLHRNMWPILSKWTRLNTYKKFEFLVYYQSIHSPIYIIVVNFFFSNWTIQSKVKTIWHLLYWKEWNGDIVFQSLGLGQYIYIRFKFHSKTFRVRLKHINNCNFANISKLKENHLHLWFSRQLFWYYFLSYFVKYWKQGHKSIHFLRGNNMKNTLIVTDCVNNEEFLRKSQKKILICYLEKRV